MAVWLQTYQLLRASLVVTKTKHQADAEVK